jgi:GMP synthase-like glutamine amidotransferase
LAADLDVRFHEIDLHAHEPIPDLQKYDALWVMGGSMNTSDETLYPWLIEEKEAIRTAVDELNLPYLAICLGHQLLAEALGGKVGESKQAELGIISIMPTEAGLGHPLLNQLPTEPDWVNVHLKEVTTPPANATVLASSTHCKNHIMAVSQHAYSCQFHPEVCSHTVENWLKINGIPEALKELLGDQGYKEFQTSIAHSLPQLNAAAKQLFVNWHALVF